MTLTVPAASSESLPLRIAAVRKQVTGIARILAGSDNRMVGASAEILDELAGELAAIETEMMQESAESLPIVSAKIEKEKSALVSQDTDTPSADTSATRSSWNDAEIQFLRTCPSSSEAIRLYHLHFGNVHNDNGIHQRWLKLKRAGDILSESDVVEVIDDDSAFSGRKGKIISWTDSRVCANFQFTDDPGSYQIPVRCLRAVAENIKNL